MPQFTLPPRGSEPAPRQESFEGAKPKKEYPVIPEGEIVECEVVEIELRDRPEWAIRNPDDETKEVSFRFRVVSGPYAKANIWGTCMPWFDYSPKCKWRLWLQGILGVDELPEGFTLETTEVDNGKGGTKLIFPEFAGKRARVEVGNRINQKTKKRSHYVADVFPTRTSPIPAEEYPDF